MNSINDNVKGNYNQESIKNVGKILDNQRVTKNNLNNDIVLFDKNNQLDLNTNIGIWKYRGIRLLTSVTNFIDKLCFNVISNCSERIKNWNIIINNATDTSTALFSIFRELVNTQTLEKASIPESILSSKSLFISTAELQKATKYMQSNNLKIASLYVEQIIILDENYKIINIATPNDMFNAKFKYIFNTNDFIDASNEINIDNLKNIEQQALPAVLDYLFDKQKIDITPFLYNIKTEACNLKLNEIIDYFKKINQQGKELDFDKITALLEQPDFQLSAEDKAKKIYEISSTKYITKDNNINTDTICELSNEDLEHMVTYLASTNVNVFPYIENNLCNITENFLANLINNIPDTSNINYQYLIEWPTSLYNKIMTDLATGAPLKEETQNKIDVYFKLLDSGFFLNNYEIMETPNQPTLLIRFNEFKMHKNAIKLLNIIKLASENQESYLLTKIKSYLDNTINGNSIKNHISQDSSIQPETKKDLLQLLDDIYSNMNVNSISNNQLISNNAPALSTTKPQVILPTTIDSEIHMMNYEGGDNIKSVSTKTISKIPGVQNTDTDKASVINNAAQNADGGMIFSGINMVKSAHTKITSNIIAVKDVVINKIKSVGRITSEDTTQNTDTTSVDLAQNTNKTTSSRISAVKNAYNSVSSYIKNNWLAMSSVGVSAIATLAFYFLQNPASQHLMIGQSF